MKELEDLLKANYEYGNASSAYGLAVRATRKAVSALEARLAKADALATWNRRVLSLFPGDMNDDSGAGWRWNYLTIETIKKNRAALADWEASK